ncbi:MAG: TolB family protein [Candidatus Binatia bacterium]
MALVLLLALGAVSAGRRAVAQSCQGAAGVERVSIASSGAQGDDRSLLPAISADGCVVAFKSSASNLVPSDRNDKVDVFVRDRMAGTTVRASLSDIPGEEANDNSFPPALDRDGGIVAFPSLASNIVRGDFNLGADVFVYDRGDALTEILTLVRDQNGEGRGGGGALDMPPSVSADGSLVAFSSAADDLVAADDNQTSDVFVHDRDTGNTTLASVVSSGSAQGRSANGASAGAVMSADGCLVAFYSDASNLVPGDTNGFRDVFVRDRCIGTTERVSVSSNGEEGNAPSQATGFAPAMSADGRYVAFSSAANNLSPGDSNGVTDIFIRDRSQGTTVRVAPGGCGTGGGAALETAAASSAPSFGANGRFLAFVSLDAGLVGGDTNGVADVFILDQSSGLIARVLGDGNVQPNGASNFPRLSADGESIVFQSDASNLVAGDTNEVSDVFVAVNPFLSGAPIPGVTPLPTCTFTPTQPGETPTRSPTLTRGTPSPAPSTPTPAGPRATAIPSTGPVTATVTPLSPPTATTTPSTPPPTGAETPTMRRKGGGGGCRLDPRPTRRAIWNVVLGLGFPLLMGVLRRRRCKHARHA